LHPVNDNILAATDGARSMTAIRDALAKRYNGSAMQRVVYTESHDEVANGKRRIPETISPGAPESLVARKRSTLGAAIVLTAPGIPMLFMGMEFLTGGSFADQKPLDWTRVQSQSGVLAMYQDLVALRTNKAGTTRGLAGNTINVFHVNDAAKVIAYHRSDKGGAGDDVVVIASFANRSFTQYDVGLPRPGTWRVRFNSDSSKYGADFANTATKDAATIAEARDGFAQKAGFALGPYAVVILSQ
jgi:1,4-alpha-glucan branching enzyme